MLDMRIMVFDRLDSYLFDIDPMQVRSATYVTEINGEHSLTIETSQELEKTNRLLLRDGMGIWHEYVVLGIEETHDAKEYYCVWSLQYDLAGTFINGPYDCGIVPGHASVPQPPRRAMEVALGGTERWDIGTISVTSTGAASFYRRSGWEGLKTVLEKWGGELQASITVSTTGVVSRAVDLLAHVGSSDATRRFDYGHDLQRIKRTISDEIWPCHIVPLGKAQETENGGYTRRPDISSVNGGVMWLQDDSVVAGTRILNPNGEYEYPTRIIENDTYEEPQEVKDWALAHLTEYTRPRVTYEANVVQLARAGLNAHGVALGDDIVVVDRTFGTDGLRITARVTKIAGSLLDPADTTLTIGNMAESLSNQFASMSRQMDQLTDTVERSQAFQATAEYVSNLIGRLNDEANATGGYTYITEGEGLRTYDTPVSDPLVGSEASQVTDLRGGTIRFANSRTSGGDWDFTTLIQAGLIATEFLTANNIVTGIIEDAAHKTDPDTGNYWDLDSGELRMTAGSAKVGNSTLGTYVSNEASAAASAEVSTLDNALNQAEILDRLTGGYTTEGLYIQNGHLYINASALKTGYMSADLIKGGTLIVGGDNNQNGVIQVKDASGNVISTLDKDGASITGDVTMIKDQVISANTYRTTVHAGAIDLDATTLVKRLLSYAVSSAMTVPGLIAKDSRGINTYDTIYIIPCYVKSTNNTSMAYHSSIASDGQLHIVGNANETNCPILALCKDDASLSFGPNYVGDSSRSRVYCDATSARMLADSAIVGDNSSGHNTYIRGTVRIGGNSYPTTVLGNFTVNGTKSRLAETDNYGRRKLYAYETPEPLFGDSGGGVIGSDGFCYVEIDDVLSETIRADMAYRVFLQKCGAGDLWVAEKHATHFVVEGTPGLAFDWELKAHQRDYENYRIEDYDFEDAVSFDPNESAQIAERSYESDLSVDAIEQLYYDELMARD